MNPYASPESGAAPGAPGRGPRGWFKVGCGCASVFLAVLFLLAAWQFFSPIPQTAPAPRKNGPPPTP